MADIKSITPTKYTKKVGSVFYPIGTPIFPPFSEVILKDLGINPSHWSVEYESEQKPVKKAPPTKMIKPVDENMAMTSTSKKRGRKKKEK